MEIKKGYPFLPLVDSLFGECLLSSWQSFKQSEESLQLLLSELYATSGNPEGQFFCTKNSDKEILHSKAPDDIRKSIELAEYSNVAKILASIATGRYMEVSHSSLDVAFELLEWILTGFDDIVIQNVLKLFLNDSNLIDEKFIKQLKVEYSGKF